MFLATEVANRWFLMKTAQWRVGVTSSTYTFAGESSLDRSAFMRNPDPYVQLVIPGASTNVLQEINTGAKLEGYIEVTNWNAVTDMLYTIDVDNSTGGTQTAILTGNSRTTIDYFVLVGTPIQIVDATDARTTPNAAYSFTNAVIGEVPYSLTKPNDPVRITFYADSVTETVA
jgi:hypothetical protein